MRATVTEGRFNRACLSGLQFPVSSLRGFTLLELLLVVSVLGILSGIVSLHLAPLFSRAYLSTGARQIATDLQLVRMKAIAQNRRFRVTFRPGTHDYIVEKDEGGTWQRQVLHGHYAELSESALVALPSGVNITAVNSGGDVVFVPRGHVDGGITITLGSAHAEGTKRVIVNLAGRVRIE